MRKKLVYPLAVLLILYGIYILQKYGMSYAESALPAEFAGFIVLTILAKFVFVFMLAVSAYGFGGTVFGRWLPRFGSLLEEGLVRSGLGLTVISYLMFALGYARLLYMPAGYAVLAAGALLGARDITVYARRVYERPRTLKLGLVNVLLISLSAMFLIEGVIYAIMPPLGFDGLMYHLGIPRQYLNAHRIFPFPDVNGSMFPFGIEMLYMLGMMVESVISAKMVSFFMGVASGLAAAAYSRRFIKGSSGLAAFTVFVSIPMVVWLMQQTYISLSQAFFVMMALYALGASHDEDSEKWLTVAALMCGFNMAIKYTGIAIVGLMTLWVFADRLVTRRTGFKTAVAGAGRFMAVAVLISSPWYIKNAIIYHNPVYPFLAGLFGNVDAGGSMPVVGSYLPHGILDSVVRIVTSLWDTTFSAYRYEMSWGNGLGPCLLMLIPGAFILGRPGRDITRLMLFCLVFFAGMMLRGNIRYIAPIFPALAVIAAYPVDRLINGEESAKKAFGNVLVVLLVFGALMSDVPRKKMTDFPPYSAAATNAYYLKNSKIGYIASYVTWKWIDENLPEDAVIYQLWDDSSVYFRKRKTIGAALPITDTGRQRIHYIAGRVGFGGFLPGEQIIANLKEMGADYFLINSNREGHTVPDDPYFKAHTMPVLEDRGVYLYRVE